jgi:hypothetical protein
MLIAQLTRHGSQKNNSVQLKLYYNVGIQILAASNGTSEPYMKSVIMMQVLDLNNSSKRTFVEMVSSYLHTNIKENMVPVLRPL